MNHNKNWKPCWSWSDGFIGNQLILIYTVSNAHWFCYCPASQEWQWHHVLFTIVKGILLSKALTCMKFFQYKQKLPFYQGDWYLWPHCCINDSYVWHRSLYASTHSLWAIGSMLISLLRVFFPGLIPFAILWYAGWTLEKTICMFMNYKYLTAIFRSILTQILCPPGII